MKLLMLQAHDYWLKPFERSIRDAEENPASISCRNAVVALVHVESIDELTPENVIRKAIKNIKWHARKVAAQTVVLHSFAHLSPSKADAATARYILDRMAERLANAGLTVQLTPFGYFNEFKLHVAGPSIAKVFVEV